VVQVFKIPIQPNKEGTLMTILYRRFILVVAFISTMGVIAANLIQETRRFPSNLELTKPGHSLNCSELQTCALVLSTRLS
jgi:hypothetical protein